jgi:hypothetical protein
MSKRDIRFLVLGFLQLFIISSFIGIWFEYQLDYQAIFLGLSLSIYIFALFSKTLAINEECSNQQNED